MTNTGNQLLFFQNLKSVIPDHISLVDQVAEVLHISEDSAYRRIRGDKQLALEEVHTLCRYFRISLDNLLGRPSQNVIFSGKYIRPETFNFSNFMQDILNLLKGIHQMKEKEMIFFSKDIPPYHYFLFPEIVAFKYFSWMRTLLDFPQLRSVKFTLDHNMDELLLMGQKIAEVYYKIPGSEVINADNILTTLRQIEYYKDAKLFASEDDLNRVYNSLEKMVDHIKHMASEGKKFLPGKDPSFSTGEYKLYVNDFYVGDNTFLLKTDKDIICFLILCGTNVFRTTDRVFSEYQDKFIKNIISKSSMISIVNEKERNAFFQEIYDRIRAYRENRVQTLGNF
ncbi:MAG TPA: hypothetical protein VK166_04715 [Chitinophagaceae bacterium]|nr:hypothetical protein [Chitinophagaceae bacterium]